MIFSFADLELDAGLYQLRRRGKVVDLAPKAFDLLLYLVRHRDRVVTKAELLDALWPGEHVTESVLPSNVAVVRKALQSGRSRGQLIQTVHGRGYRFTAEVEAREEATASTSLKTYEHAGWTRCWARSTHSSSNDAMRGDGSTSALYPR